MQRDKNKATCRRFIQQIFNEGKLSSIRDFVSGNGLHHELDGWHVPAGRSAERFADMIGLYRLAFPDLRVEIQDQIAESDRVVSSVRMQGTQTGPLLGIGASGKTVDITGIRVDRLAEDKISESWFYMDGLGMLEQIGALPKLTRSPEVAPQATKTSSSPQVPIPIAPPRTKRPRPHGARLKPAA